ncbi:phage tail assembly chaperone [Paracidovorax cattleyae]|uniref:Phage tail assembly chaperone n=1 Tax=Paracidovorax cattleyae TaxID=80868 RepID=A0A1H0RJT7_9BURK|nr:phage tail assembly chaperone [Paracidovorax cattleyae]SDP29158.1 Phage tail assembly chaperone [Paracidovorax cattleyae]
MAKIVLGKRPETFKRIVSVPLLDGSKGTIECVFRYRTRKEFGALVDGIRAEAEKTGAQATAEAATAEEGVSEKPWSLRDHFDKLVGTNAEYMLQILVGWNLDVDLSAESLQQLSDELPAASEAIVDAYRVAITEGRLGN